jgi:hypothetical protein
VSGVTRKDQDWLVNVVTHTHPFQGTNCVSPEPPASTGTNTNERKRGFMSSVYLVHGLRVLGALRRSLRLVPTSFTIEFGEKGFTPHHC